MMNIPEPVIFEWDKGNASKNLHKHEVADSECEETFTDEHKRLYKDVFHSQREDRYILIGKTNAGRLLNVVFTKRKDMIRVISARDLNKKERRFYEEET